MGIQIWVWVGLDKNMYRETKSHAQETFINVHLCFLCLYLLLHFCVQCDLLVCIAIKVELQ